MAFLDDHEDWKEQHMDGGAGGEQNRGGGRAGGAGGAGLAGRAGRTIALTIAVTIVRSVVAPPPLIAISIVSQITAVAQAAAC